MTGSDLSTWREARGLTQLDAANLVGHSQGRWSRWERGEAPVPRYVVRALELLGELEALRDRDIAVP